MSSALDEFRAQREVVEGIAIRLEAVGAMLKELRRQNLRFGLATLCVGGGQGGALLLERGT